MSVAQVFFDPNRERVIIQDPGNPDIRVDLRDEAAVERFARSAGYFVATPWEVLPANGASTYWERAELLPAS